MKKSIVIFNFLACFLNVNLLANIGPQGFFDFMNPYFVETGTYVGNGVQQALIAGFREIRTIELDAKCHLFCVERFAQLPNVKIHKGSSSTDLWKLIEDIDQPITFWLDAHVYPPRKDGGKNCPLLEELDQIKRHPIKTHTILIDDMHCCGSEAFDFLTIEDLKNKLLEINENYQIFFVPGGDKGEYPENVMVAQMR